MQGRTRTKLRSRLSGQRYRRSPLLIEGPFPYDTDFWKCEDFIKKGKSKLTGRTPPSDLTLTKSEFKPVLLNYVHRNGGNVENRYSNVPCNVPGSAITTPPGGWALYEGNDTELVAKLLANTNPFRYEVSVPIMVSELAEAGGLLRLGAQNFIAAWGNSHLNWEFGWKPLIADIKTLASITTAVESRIRDFNALLEKGGIRRRKSLSSGGTSTGVTETSIYSSGLGEWRGRVQTSYRTKVWGTVRWVPDRLEPVDIAKLTSFNQALMVALDLGPPDLSTMWEATPWTWLVDYFVNVGDTLQAIEANDLVVPSEICLMRQREVETSCGLSYGPPSGGANIKTSSGSAGYAKHVIKLRKAKDTPTGVSDLLSFGFMSKAQATNLLALVASLARFR